MFIRNWIKLGTYVLILNFTARKRQVRENILKLDRLRFVPPSPYNARFEQKKQYLGTLFACAPLHHIIMSSVAVLFAVSVG